MVGPADYTLRRLMGAVALVLAVPGLPFGIAAVASGVTGFAALSEAELCVPSPKECGGVLLP